MTRNQMIQRVAKAIKNGKSVTVIADNGNSTECIYRLQFIDATETENSKFIVSYYDEEEPTNPFNDGEMFQVYTWLTPSIIVDMLLACNKL